MHVHLVTIKVGVVRRRHAQVEAKRAVRHDAHAVTHDTHLVQARLAVEQHQVAVLHVALNLVAEL